MHTSCDLLIFVYQAAEVVASYNPVKLRRGVLGKGSYGSGLGQGSMWTVTVVVPLVLP
jgi:hypothetical protein